MAFFSQMMFLLRTLNQYLRDLKPDKIILWCYLIWYIVTVYYHFDPNLKLWLNSLGISAVIGTGLILSVSRQPLTKIDYWQVFRLYAMPFCVSSFSSLIKDQGFLVFIAPKFQEVMTALSSCLTFWLIVSSVKLVNSKFPVQVIPEEFPQPGSIHLNQGKISANNQPRSEVNPD